MKHLKKINFVLLPLAIWGTMIFYHGIILKPFSDLMMNISAPFVLSFVIHTIVQLLVISSLTVTAVKKLGYKLKYSIISVNVCAFCNLVPTVNLYVCVYGRSANRLCIRSACNAILGIVYFHNSAIWYCYADNNADCLQKEVCK